MRNLKVGMMTLLGPDFGVEIIVQVGEERVLVFSCDEKASGLDSFRKEDMFHKEFTFCENGKEIKI